MAFDRLQTLVSTGRRNVILPLYPRPPFYKTEPIPCPRRFFDWVEPADGRKLFNPIMKPCSCSMTIPQPLPDAGS